MNATREELKQAMKEALIEAIEERRDLVRQFIEDIIEDVGLANAMREADGDELVPEEEVIKVLRSED